MSIVISASTHRLTRTTDLPDYNAPWAVSLWAYITSLPDLACILFALGRNDGSDDDNLEALDNSGTGWKATLGIRISNSFTSSSGATVFPYGHWYHIFGIRVSATRALMYVNGQLEVDFTHSTVSGRASPTQYILSGSTIFDTGRLDGYVARFKFWTAGDFNTGQVRNEQHAAQPFRTQGLYAFWPGEETPNGQLLDASGRGRHFTVASGLRSTNPPVPYTLRRLARFLLKPGASVTPAAASAIAGRVNPTVVHGSISFTPAARNAIAQSIAPTVILGSVTATPAPASVISQTVAPVVIFGSVNVTPAAIQAVAQALIGAIESGDINLTPDVAQAIARTLDPTVVLSDIFVTPGAVYTIARVVEPEIILGSTIATPAPASAVASTVAPTVILGSIVIWPGFVWVVARTSGPDVLGDIALVLLTLFPRDTLLLLFAARDTLHVLGRDGNLTLGDRPVQLELSQRLTELTLPELEMA
jgi:hypothetical protein